MPHLSLLLLPLLTAAAAARGRWFLTGREEHGEDARNFSQFAAQTEVKKWSSLISSLRHRNEDRRELAGGERADLFSSLLSEETGTGAVEEVNDTALLFGGAISVLEKKKVWVMKQKSGKQDGDGDSNVHIDDNGDSIEGVEAEEEEVTVKEEVERFLQGILMINKDNVEAMVLHQYGVFVSRDYYHPLGLEIGLLLEHSVDFTERRIHQLSLGKEYRFIVVLREGFWGLSEHYVIITEDIKGRLSLSQHTWKRFDIPGDVPTTRSTAATGTGGYNLRLMTYNIWHNNPPTWVVSSSKRAAWYSSRLALLSQYISEQDPDIITFQEVRLDSMFSHEFASSGDNATRPPLESMGRRSGSQMHHLLDALQQHLSSVSSDNCSECNDVLCKYQLVYQPAMSMFNRNKPFERNEEGVAMLIRSSSKSRKGSKGEEYRLEVSRVQPLFLPRDLDNKMDDHHRVILHAEVELIPTNSHASTLNPIIDVMTTHLSLSSPARVHSMEVVWKFATSSKDAPAKSTVIEDSPLVEEVEVMAEGDSLKTENNDVHVPSASLGYTKGHIQVLTGDFNAEPHESAYLYITGQGDGPGDYPRPDFQDAWVLGGEEENPSDGFTFPSCNAVKRIDFILLRNASEHNIPDSSAQWRSKVIRTERVGLEPTPETADGVGSREGLGMLDLDSPIWASDHFGLVSDLWISRNGNDY